MRPGWLPLFCGFTSMTVLLMDVMDQYYWMIQAQLRGRKMQCLIEIQLEVTRSSMLLRLMWRNLVQPTVSCTDILTLAAREAVYVVGGPYWALPLGRRDGLTANETEANELPSPFEPLDNIIRKFSAKGLDLRDTVVLSGAHTIGFAQCFTFKQRLFNFDGNGNPDPALDAAFRQSLQSVCPNQNNSDTQLVALDAATTKQRFCSINEADGQHRCTNWPKWRDKEELQGGELERGEFAE
ncbi:hypothetical protein Patl1_28756 [Pistacia atlantica]|uniref:Uncharacterized protein n=1 Tax=Pistacia atlantica TaxID=434234 RepID=A0ACC1BCS5_9ROSI|nr:hypothetical protein Patl1_28756 [Pistacia atlantica]